MSEARRSLRPPLRLASVEAVERARAREMMALLGALYRALMAGDREEVDRLRASPAATALPREVREELVLLRRDLPRTLRAPVNLLVFANRLHQLLRQGPGEAADQLRLDLRLPADHLPARRAVPDAAAGSSGEERRTGTRR